ncbi:hypothetical protein G6O69_21770 [Pseudenhygromyxa sp. WMMC2535]|uniref:P-II family nitrogen regulator n=1 Tax=Pseudenhygromyxa sp. WMMC2535 TaxID=2712867 RepID=UPI0015567E3E|nr:hypothetical protein [Pseudenhygromyxa sp. WMMC2535]NVB40484.1 hypothetical protein [Pseudenhygromyxa sp. WMMC2535]
MARLEFILLRDRLDSLIAHLEEQGLRHYTVYEVSSGSGPKHGLNEDRNFDRDGSVHVLVLCETERARKALQTSADILHRSRGIGFVTLVDASVT